MGIYFRINTTNTRMAYGEKILYTAVLKKGILNRSYFGEGKKIFFFNNLVLWLKKNYFRDLITTVKEK